MLYDINKFFFTSTEVWKYVVFRLKVECGNPHTPVGESCGSVNWRIIMQCSGSGKFLDIDQELVALRTHLNAYHTENLWLSHQLFPAEEKLSLQAIRAKKNISKKLGCLHQILSLDKWVHGSAIQIQKINAKELLYGRLSIK